MRYSRIVTLLACTALLWSAGAAAASAQDNSEGDDDRSRTPSGQVQLAGNGTISVVGRLTITANLPRRSLVRIVGRDGDASVRIAGRPVPLRGGRGAVRSSGIVFASGTDVVIMVTGPRVSLSAAGLGRVAVRGFGRMSINQGPVRRWTRGAIQLAPPTDPRTRRGAGPARGVRR